MNTFSPNASTRGSNQARLLEDEADLEYMKGNLQKMDDLTQRMSGMLDSFDGRLVKLEASILPIHKSTQNLTQLASNIDATLKSTDSIVKCMDLPSKEETLILKGPDENNTLPYLQSLARLRDALEILSAAKLKATEKVTNQLKQLLKAGTLHLETLFRKWLSSASVPLDARSHNTEPPSMDPAQIKRLSQLSTYLSTSESELGYAVDFTKPYIEIRSAYLSKSMHNLSQIAAADRQTGVYERGSAEFLRYMAFLTKMFTFEYDLATRLLSNPVHRTAALKGTFASALTDFIAAGKAINAHARRSSYQDVFMILDVLERYESECNSVLEKILPRKEMDTILELITALRGTALRSIYEFMEDVKGRKDPANPNLSNDGTVHELTSNTLSHLKRIWGWNDIAEPVLLILGNDGWNNPVTPAAEQQPLSLKSTPEGRSLLKNFFVDVLDQLNNTLQAKSKAYRKPALAVIFLLNNYNHVLRQIRSPPLNAIFDEGREARFGKLVRRQMDAYQETWKPCIENLMDVTYVRGGAIKQSLGNNERQQIKDKFRNFNVAFEEIWRTQKTYAIPDSELRFAIIRDVKNVLLPMYSRFIEKYQGADFTKNTAKYIRWDRDQLDRMLNQLFEPAASLHKNTRQMDQETANVLFDKGGILLFLEAPENMEFGIDYNAWTTGPLFKGIKLIPPGLHFVYYSSTSKEGLSGMRTGFFRFFEAGEVVVKEWDNQTESLRDDSELDNSQMLRYSRDIKSFDKNLGAYPLDPPTNWQRWLNLTNYIKSSLVRRVFPNNGFISHIPAKSENSLPGLLEELDRRMGREVIEKEEGVEFTKFDLKQSFPTGASGQEVTKWSLDKSWLTKSLLANVYHSDYHYLLGEFQLAFVATLLGQNFSSFHQWKKLMQLLCSCQELMEESPQLFNDFLEVLTKQMKECPQEFFYEILSEDNFVSQVLKTLALNIPASNIKLRQQYLALHEVLKKEFNWEIPGLSSSLKNKDENPYSDEDDEEEGEYAPAIVEL